MIKKVIDLLKANEASTSFHEVSFEAITLLC